MLPKFSGKMFWFRVMKFSVQTRGRCCPIFNLKIPSNRLLHFCCICKPFLWRSFWAQTDSVLVLCFGMKTGRDAALFILLKTPSNRLLHFCCKCAPFLWHNFWAQAISDFFGMKQGEMCPISQLKFWAVHDRKCCPVFREDIFRFRGCEDFSVENRGMLPNLYHIFSSNRLLHICCKCTPLVEKCSNRCDELNFL